VVVVRILIGSLRAARGQSFGEQLSSDSMSPLVDAALIKAMVAEKMQVAIKLFPRDTTHITVEVQASSLPQAVEARALPAPDVSGDGPTASAAESRASLAVVLPIRIGVVKAYDFVGTRVHVEFALLNDTDRLVAIRNVMLLIGSGDTPDAATFKQFVDVTSDVRVPSLKYRLPVVIPARSGLWFCTEVESPFDVGLGTADRECSLVVAATSGHVVGRFTATGNSILAEVLEEIQKTANELKGAASLALPISLRTS
jgi:hypothetical protein